MSLLETLDACYPGQAWADAQNSYKDAWEKCENGDWMLWIAKVRGIDLRILTLASARCAHLVQHLMTHQRSLDALSVAQRYGHGLASLAELEEAAAAAAFAANDAFAAVAVADNAADAIAFSAIAAKAKANNAAFAAKADNAAAVAAVAAATAADDETAAIASNAAAFAAAVAGANAAVARKEMLKKCADICRETIPYALLNIEGVS